MTLISRILIALKLRKPEPPPLTPAQLRIQAIKADMLSIAALRGKLKIRRPVEYKRTYSDCE